MSLRTTLLSTLAIGVAAFGLSAATPASAMVDGDTIVLGSAISFTGKYSTNGIHAKNGYNIAVKRVNEMGGVKVGGKSYKLKIIYYDDESTPARTAQLLERLIKQDGVKYMLGPYSSATTLAAAPITEKYKIPMIEAEGASRALFTKGYRYLFAVLSTAEQYLSATVSLAADIGAKTGKKPGDITIAMAFENDAFSLDVREGVLDEVKKLGLKVVIDDKLPRDLSDMSATLTKVRALKPDVLLISGHSKGAVTAGRQIQEMKIDTPIIAMTHCEAAKVVDKYGPSADGFLCPTQWSETLSSTGKYFGSAGDFDRDFKAAYEGYDKSVPYQSAQAAAAVLVWKEAFERAQDFDTEKVRDAIAATDMQTFYGAIRFSEAGNNIAKPFFLRQIQKGEYHVVAPLSYAVKPIDYPRKPN
ncbi:MAG: amino acid ABC transporter substrate-binding protein [Rhodospirillales bacterium]|nr:amino acid ABC transporter substrate-binding protein [Rhodospirillales bacterium]